MRSLNILPLNGGNVFLLRDQNCATLVGIFACAQEFRSRSMSVTEIDNCLWLCTIENVDLKFHIIIQIKYIC